MDLFCGTGNLGLECISRGAAMCYFADTDTKLVMKNIEALNAGERSKVIKISAENFYDEYQELKPDMIFCDPPYAYNRHDFLLEKISGYKTLVILEHPENYKSEANTEKYIVFRKKIGTVNFTLFDFRKLK